ncbi:MAG: APC family permease [Actinomycetota bacterium]|nr:APC family permease [Actinomycetota bacterium]
MPIKQLLIGRPLAQYEEQEQRLPKRIGLAVFASDALSSTAYATEEILHILLPIAAMAALEYLVPISFVVMVLLAIVATSYRQVCYAYPNGGGGYIVASDNLGETASLVSGASLMIDYSLTVAVSVSAGVAAVVSAFPHLASWRVPVALIVVAVMTYGNLRGAKEAGTVFAVPTYLYLLALGSLLGYGLFRSFFGGLGPVPVDEEQLAHFTGGGEVPGLVGAAGVLYIARAFSSGAVALTGTEAIANGVPAFRPPESKNAARTLIMMATILGLGFFGISTLAHRLRPTLHENETLLSVMGGQVFGRGTVLYYFLQFATMAILFLAANTAYNGFPHLANVMAKEGYLPRQLANRGDRLVYSNGILILAGAAALLLVAFGGVTTALIPLYAVGVFTDFTIAQAGMVRRHRRLKADGWKLRVAISGVGAVATGVVLIVVVVSKFTTGAWIPVVVIPIIILLCRGVHRHYVRVGSALEADPEWRPPRMQHTVIVLVAGVHKGVLRALTYGRSLAPNYLTALTIVDSEEQRASIEQQWEQYGVDVPLTVVTSSYRELTRPVLRFLDDLDERWDNDIITVIIPEFVVDKWWAQLLHNQSALMLKGRLLFRKNTAVTSVPTHLGD